MLAKLNTFALVGIDAVPVEVEVDVSAGLPKTVLVGLPEMAVKESVHRIERALVNLGYDRHPGRTVINLAPADLPKSAGGFDLPIALGLLVATGQLLPEQLKDFATVGELALDGSIRPVKGALSMAMAAAQRGLPKLLENTRWAPVAERIGLAGPSDSRPRRWRPWRSSVRRRVLPNGMESAAQVDQGGCIQQQRRHSGPAGGGAPLDEQEIRAPGKMTRPELAARVEQGDGPARLRIAGMRLGVLVAVARRARPGQVGRRTAGAACPRDDVLADEGGTREAGGVSAVLAAVAGAVAHLPPDRPRDPLTPHLRSLRAPPSRPARTAPAAGQLRQRFGPCGVDPLRLLGQRLVLGQLFRGQLAAFAPGDEPPQAALRHRRQTGPGCFGQRTFVRPWAAVGRLPRGEAALELALLGRRQVLDRIEQLFHAPRTGPRYGHHRPFLLPPARIVTRRVSRIQRGRPLERAGMLG